MIFLRVKNLGPNIQNDFFYFGLFKKSLKKKSLKSFYLDPLFETETYDFIWFDMLYWRNVKSFFGVFHIAIVHTIYFRHL